MVKFLTAVKLITKTFVKIFINMLLKAEEREMKQKMTADVINCLAVNQLLACSHVWLCGLMYSLYKVITLHCELLYRLCSLICMCECLES